MPRTFTLTYDARSVALPVSAAAAHDEVPTTFRPANAFAPDMPESVLLEGILPDAFQGAGTLKLDVYYCADTTAPVDDARLDVATEFRTPDAATPEPLDADDFDPAPDSATLNFSTTAYSLHKATLNLTPAVAPAAGDKFRVRITRDAADLGGLDDLLTDLLITDYVLYEEI